MKERGLTSKEINIWPHEETPKDRKRSMKRAFDELKSVSGTKSNIKYGAVEDKPILLEWAMEFLQRFPILRELLGSSIEAATCRPSRRVMILKKRKNLVDL